VDGSNGGDALPCYVCGGETGHWWILRLPSGGHAHVCRACVFRLTREAADAQRDALDIRPRPDWRRGPDGVAP